MLGPCFALPWRTSPFSSCSRSNEGAGTKKWRFQSAGRAVALTLAASQLSWSSPDWRSVAGVNGFLFDSSSSTQTIQGCSIVDVEPNRCTAGWSGPAGLVAVKEALLCFNKQDRQGGDMAGEGPSTPRVCTDWPCPAAGHRPATADECRGLRSAASNEACADCLGGQGTVTGHVPSIVGIPVLVPSLWGFEMTAQCGRCA